VRASIIVPVCNYGKGLIHITANCIGSIRQHTKDFELVVIDNASSAGRQKFFADKYFRFKRNMGIAPAWNKGLELASGKYVCIMNNDIMVFGKTWLDDLIAALEKLDIVSPSILPDPLTERYVEAMKRRRNRFGRKITGCCFLASKKTFDEIGEFDERFEGAYYEDTDYFRRAELLGKKLGNTEMVWIYHMGWATTNGLRQTEVNAPENKKWFEEKWGKDAAYSIKEKIAKLIK